MSLLNKITKKLKVRDVGDFTSRKPHKHGGHLWCNGIYYQPRDIAALIMGEEYYKQRVKDFEIQLNLKDAQIKALEFKLQSKI